MLRPFLDISKQTIQMCAEEHQLTWVTDPSNACDDFDRNFLRNQLIPLVKTRWRQVDKTVARTAQHCAAAQMLLNDVAENLLAEILHEDNTLSISQLQQLSQQKQSLVVRAWFNQQGLKMPSAGFISAIFTEVIHAKTSAEPSLKKAGLVIRRYQDTLYCLKDLPGFKNLAGLVWQAIENKVILPDNSVLVRYPAHDGIPLSLWQQTHVTVRFRQGGEKMRLTGRQGQHTLKNLFQAAQIPPWQRDKIPLLYFDDQLVAVANLWLSSEVQAADDKLCYRIDWLPTQ
jgi:tRNA(Ile)-lysidine synthase